MNIAQSVTTEKDVFKRKCISCGWFRRFLGRQPEFGLHKGYSTTKVRMDAMAKKESIENVFPFERCLYRK